MPTLHPDPDPSDSDPVVAQREAALAFLYGRIDYERARNVPYRSREFRLERMRELLAGLGNPQESFSIVHVAGTKGKGSTAAMIAAVLTAAGYRAGLFTSPHLDRIEERWRVDGRIGRAPRTAELTAQVRPVVEAMDRRAEVAGGDEIGPTYFEITTAMALLQFQREGADVAVLEVGLGGRLDSTNVCRPCVSLITSISFDHTRQLGNTLESIAREKAGIVKPGIPVTSGVTAAEPREVIREVCRQQRAPLVELGVDFDYRYRPPRGLETKAAQGTLDFTATAEGARSYRGLALGLLGRHQAANAAVALATLEELRKQGWRIGEEAIRAGLVGATLPARVELLGRHPTIVADAAHNRASIEALLEVLEESFSAARRWLVFGTTEDKDVRQMLARLLERFDEVVFTCYLDNPRGVPPAELQRLSRELAGRECPALERPAEAWELVRAGVGPQDLVCVTGSFFLVAEMGREIARRPLPAARGPQGADG